MTRVFLFLAAVVVGCGSEPSSMSDAAETREGEERAARAEVAETGSAAEVRPGVRIDRILRASGDLSQLLPVLRTPRSARAEPVRNRHVPGQIDTVRTWGYDGLELEVYETAEGRALLQRLAVTSGTYGTSDGLSVGETRDALESVLGPPASSGSAGVTYRVDGALPTVVRVVYEPDEDGVPRASEIEWRPPLG